MVFIDDLTSATVFRAHTQEIADLVGAFNAIFGTRCAVEKFRAVTTHGPEEEDLIIRDWNWEPTTVKFQDGHACIRTLGVNVNHAGTWDEQVQEVTHWLGRIGNIVRASKASSFTKIKVLRLSVQEGVLYKAAGSTWPLKAIKKINDQIAQMIRKALRLPPSYPYALIHAKVGGLGITSFSQMHQEHIERVLKRCMAGPEPGASAARGLANRAFRTMDKEDTGLGRGGAVAQFSPTETYMKALLAQGDKTGEKWVRKGNPEEAHMEHIATRVAHMDPATYEWVRKWNRGRVLS